jgi:hypothetical protein
MTDAMVHNFPIPNDTNKMKSNLQFLYFVAMANSGGGRAVYVIPD